MPWLCGIPGGQWQIGAPAPMTDVNDLLIAQNAVGDRSEFDPVFASNGLDLYVTSDQGGSWDIWVAKRTSIDAPFSVVARSSVSTTSVEFGYQPLDAVDAAVISANYRGGPDLDYYFGARAGGPSWRLSALSSNSTSDNDARLTDDGLDIYIVRGEPGVPRDIYVASRTAIDVDFGTPRAVAELNTSVEDSSPVPVGKLEILFARTEAPQVDDIFLASRSSGAEPFGEPFRLDALASDAFDGEPAVYVGSDTCEIVFVSNRSGVFNLYRAEVSRL